MARGNQKSQSSTPVKAVPEAPVARATESEALSALLDDWKSPKSMDAAQRFADDIRAGNDEGKKAAKALVSFSMMLEDYQNNNHNTTGGYKFRRKNLVDAFRALPEYLRNAMLVPKHIVEYSKQHIIRGGDHASRPGPDGEIIASFTTQVSTAKAFPMVSNQKQDGSVYSLDDAEHIEGVINIAKANRLRYEMSTVLPKPDSMAGSFINKYWPASPRSGESEYIVFGIKWKPEVDTPAWRAAHANEERTLKNALNYKLGL